MLVWFAVAIANKDANERIAKPPDDAPRDERLAVLAVVDWRTGQLEAANISFMNAAAENPAWMVPRSVENCFSASAAKVLKQLEAAENARRLKELQKRAQAMSH